MMTALQPGTSPGTSHQGSRARLPFQLAALPAQCIAGWIACNNPRLARRERIHARWLPANMASAPYSPVTAEQATAFLRAHLGPGVSAARRLGHGEWSTAYQFVVAGRRLVIRFSALREDFDKDQHASAFRSPRLPIPRIEDIGAAFGGYYAVSEWIAGGYLDDLEADGLRKVLPSLFATLDAIRQADVSHTTGYGLRHGDGAGVYGSWQAYLLHVAVDEPGARIHPWREPLERQHPSAAAAFDTAYAALRPLVEACPEARHLVHSDLLNYNVLFAGDRVSAVLDWGSALYGDFLYDLAWLCFWQPWYPAWQSVDFAAEARRHHASIGLDVPDFDQRLRAYQVHIGLDSLTYNAYRGRWDQLDSVAQRTLATATVAG